MLFLNHCFVSLNLNYELGGIISSDDATTPMKMLAYDMLRQPLSTGHSCTNAIVSAIKLDLAGGLGYEILSAMPRVTLLRFVMEENLKACTKELLSHDRASVRQGGVSVIAELSIRAFLAVEGIGVKLFSHESISDGKRLKQTVQDQVQEVWRSIIDLCDDVDPYVSGNAFAAIDNLFEEAKHRNLEKLDTAFNGYIAGFYF